MNVSVSVCGYVWGTAFATKSPAERKNARSHSPNARKKWTKLSNVIKCSLHVHVHYWTALLKIHVPVSRYVWIAMNTYIVPHYSSVGLKVRPPPSPSRWSVMQWETRENMPEKMDMCATFREPTVYTIAHRRMYTTMCYAPECFRRMNN